ncbi:hypothetical protein BC831DRAFT_551818, partial [Entophlyctis helioformis]
MAWAAEGGFLDVVIWLHDKRRRGTDEAMDRAAGCGRTAVVQWLHERTYGCTTDAMDGALGRLYDTRCLAVAEWLLVHRKEGCSHEAIGNAFKARCGKSMRFLLKNCLDQFTVRDLACLNYSFHHTLMCLPVTQRAKIQMRCVEAMTDAYASIADLPAPPLDEPAAKIPDLGRSTVEQRAVVEQVVGASSSQAVEPGQPAATSATTAQPGVPRYVVPPATGDLAFGSSHWDGKPAEIHALILKAAGPLTRFLCGLLGDKRRIDYTTRLQLWTEAFKMDWQGDLALLPDVKLTADNGLLLAHSRSMYDRLCKRFPLHTEPFYSSSDAYKNNYYQSFYNGRSDSQRLLLIPMRHGWFDLLDFTYPIVLARLAICFGCLDLLKHLDD